MVRDAGKQILKDCRRRQILCGVAAAALLGSWRGAWAARSLISPAGHYQGARLLRQVDPQGMPTLQGEVFGAMTFFVYPVSVAASPFDIFVADAGLGTLFRYDPTLDAMMPIPGVRVGQQTRIAAAPDGSVVVTEGRAGPARRYARGGRQMQVIDPMNTGSRFDEILVDATSGRFIGLDRVQHRIEEIQPLGRSGAILPMDLLPLLPTAMALDGKILYAAGQDCRCVVAIDLLRRDSQAVAEDATQINAMAAGDGWLVVADIGLRELRIYRDRVLRGDPSFEALGLMNPQGMSINRNTLYVADPGAQRISTFHLRP